MSAVVVFESMFGNTQVIAEAIAAGIGSATEVAIFEVSQAPRKLAADVDLVVVGAPTHAHGLSRPQSRESAAKQGPIVSRGIGLRDWLGDVVLPAAVRVAAFDTRFAKPRWLTGSAALTVRKLMRRNGYAGQVTTESFFVHRTAGPLRDGDVERAREWGAALVDRQAAMI